MNEEFELVAKTFQGLEDVLAKELTELGANNLQIGRRMVSFTGNKAMMYKANFCLRTAIRILKPIKHFKAKSADEVYKEVKNIAWDNYLNPNKTFAVDATVFSEVFRHSMFVTYKVKDAIADYFREKTGKRPSVSVTNPSLLLNIHISDDDCTLSLDSSGESLHRRGYRQEAVEAPLNEILAAGLILLTGWHGECDLIDPMCGSGTIPIEAALIARNIAPGIFRKSFAFEKWPDFDQELFDDIYNDDSKEREFNHHIYGYDNNLQAIGKATNNAKAAGVSKYIALKIQDFVEFTQPAEKSIIITNPPYGERISTDDLLGLYKIIGERLKHQFVGNDAWIISYKEECFDAIGLKPSDRISLYNGALACEFRKYQIFSGKYNDFRTEHHERKFKTNSGKFRPHHLGEELGDIQKKGKESSDETKEREDKRERRFGDRRGYRPFGDKQRDRSSENRRENRSFGNKREKLSFKDRKDRPERHSFADFGDKYEKRIDGKEENKDFRVLMTYPQRKKLEREQKLSQDSNEKKG